MKEKRIMTLAEQIEAHKGTMTLKALAEILGVSYDTTYKWVRKYGLPATKVGGTYWVDPELAANWWRNHSTTSAKPPASIRSGAAKVSHVA
jgi:excisionase family DNA binding protein